MSSGYDDLTITIMQLVLCDRQDFFLKLKENPTVEALSKIFENNIIPLLQEYFYDDFEKIQLVLGNKIIKSEEINNNIFNVKSDNIIENKKRYSIDNEALNQIDSYNKTDDSE